jgi:hypothetical protein
MAAFLTGPGVPEELRAFFNREETGSDDGWLAGNAAATELIVTSGRPEAIAFMTVNAYRYTVTDALLFFAVGNLPDARRLDRIRAARQKRKITLVFSNDLLGSLLDITVAAGLTGRSVGLRWSDGRVEVDAGNRKFAADPGRLTLNYFEQMTGTRSGIRTRKPRRYNTFLEQLKYDTE